MTTRPDLPPARPLPAGVRAAMRRNLEAAVTRRHRRAPLLITAGAVAVAAATSAGAYAYTQHSAPVTDQGSARCYTVPSLDDGDLSYAAFAEASRPGGSPSRIQVDDALSVCASEWRQGLLHAGPHGAGGPGPKAGTVIRLGSGQGHDHVPPLTACVLPGGAAGVFPGPHSVCAALHLPSAAG